MSVLLVYEGAEENDIMYDNNNLFESVKARSSDCEKIGSKRFQEEPVVDVKLIDFAFVFPTKEKDESSIEGLTNLINAFKQLTKS